MENENCFAQIPLKVFGSIPVGVGRDVYILIFYRAKLSKSLEHIKIKDTDKKMLGLNRLSYYRGIRVLIDLRLISVVKNSHGSAYLITLNQEKMPQNMLDYILKGKPNVFNAKVRT